MSEGRTTKQAFGSKGWRIGLGGVMTGLLLGMVGCSGDSTTRTIPVTAPTPATSTPTVTAVRVTGPERLTTAGATAQFTATVTLSTGAIEDRTSSAQWASENPGVASVAANGLVTAVADGASAITASFGTVRGSAGLMVVLPKRTPDPVGGARLPLPNVRAFVEQLSAARPDLMGQSCPGNPLVKYRNNPWLDYIVDELRKQDTRWGYNAKPTRGPSDNGGQPVIAAGDEIAYNYGAGPDEGSRNVYLIDVLAGHCGPTPSVTWRDFTGEEPGIWTGLGRF